MGWYANLFQPLENILRDAVVEHTLTINQRVLFCVERRCIVLEMLDQRARFWPFKEDLGFAFVNTAAPVHCVVFLNFAVGSGSLTTRQQLCRRSHLLIDQIFQEAC